MLRMPRSSPRTRFHLSSQLALIILFCLTRYLSFNSMNCPSSPSTGNKQVIIQHEHLQGSNYSISHFSSLLTGLKPLNIRKSALLNLNSGSDSSSWLSALLILSGDLEVNPGPRTFKFPCGVCSRPCKSNQKAIQCDSCNTWLHTKCIQLDTKTYEALANSSVSWHCNTCGQPNFSTSLFNSHDSSKITNNPFDLLSPDTQSPSKFQPQQFSTPKRPTNELNRSKAGSTPNNPLKDLKKTNPKLKCLVANFQSLRGKLPLFSNYCSENKPDIVFGSETWLLPKMKKGELLLDDYEVYRNERESGYGGVMCVSTNPITVN